MVIAMKVTGAEELMSNLKKLTKKVGADLSRAMLTEGELIMTESQRQVPRLTGFLANSRSVELSERRSEIVVVLSYGADYAFKVHESFTVRSGKRKYLEDPLKAASGGMADRIAKRIKL